MHINLNRAWLFPSLSLPKEKGSIRQPTEEGVSYIFTLKKLKKQTPDIAKTKNTC